MNGQYVINPTSQRTEHHHGSHRQLLSKRLAIPFPVDVDAIIVPTARMVSHLDPAIALAEKLQSTLVALCSKESSASEVAKSVEGRGVKLIAIDVGDLPVGVVPSFRTCEVLAGTPFERHTDTSLKRNLGLLLARLIGWKRIVFLDDDIKVPEATDLREAAGLTDHYAGVGLTVKGMPDNSVVCHAFREAGGAQDVFIGGGALAVGTQSVTSFFPNIYNEDWFFLLDDDGLRPTTTTGTAVQKTYDPFREERARTEELGDSLAEGLFWLLDNGRSLRDADAVHWRNFLRRRVEFITRITGMANENVEDPERRYRIELALKASQDSCLSITPELCVRYIDAWRGDRVTWRRHVEWKRWTVSRSRKMAQAEWRSLAGVREMFRLLGFPDQIVRLHLPQESFDHDLADFDLALPVAVGE
jgi:hypothetical protein